MLLAWLAFGCVIITTSHVRVQKAENRVDRDDRDDRDEGDEARIARGFQIAPVPLKFKHKNRSLVGLGSYIVNAQAGCSDCHTNPPFRPGGDPHLGQPEQINTDGYLAGGQAFGPFISRNLTPDSQGLPAGMTLEKFIHIMRTGEDDDHIPPNVPSVNNDLLQVMPWPVYRKMSDHDLRAIYEYLSAIPSRPGYPH
jgi:mono/diheme cytochrome c family protein